MAFNGTAAETAAEKLIFGREDTPESNLLHKRNHAFLIGIMSIEIGILLCVRARITNPLSSRNPIKYSFPVTFEQNAQKVVII